MAHRHTGRISLPLCILALVDKPFGPKKSDVKFNNLNKQICRKKWVGGGVRFNFVGMAEDESLRWRHFTDCGKSEIKNYKPSHEVDAAPSLKKKDHLRKIFTGREQHIKKKLNSVMHM